MLKLAYYNKTGYHVPQKKIFATAKNFSKICGYNKGELEIIVINDKEMKKLNYHYRGKNRTTDVLSFAFQEDRTFVSDFLGQIFVCFPQIKRQAKQYGVSTEQEFIRMLAHGLLHLVGYGHDTKINQRKMYGLQEKLVKNTD